MYLAPGNPKQVHDLSTWFSRLLSRHGWSNRKKTVSQANPDNWRELSVKNAMKIRKNIEAGIYDVVINADETFLKFYHDATHVLTPFGSK